MMTMVHDIKVEERMFSADIQALCDYDDGFNEAWNSGSEYEMTIMLSDLFGICPRSYQRTLMYERLVKFLGMKNITLKVISMKTKNKKGN